jgi:hypothetical protein
MIKKYTVSIILALVFITAGCSDFGKVDQGRVVAYDKEQKIVTIIKDKSVDPKKPDYSVLPPVTYKMPDDPGETGPEPKAGYRMKLDLEKKQVVIFMPKINNFVTVGYNLIEQKEVAQNDPLIFDKETNKQKKFPVIDQQNRTISIYSKRQKTYVVISVSDDYFALPPETWDSGDEVRIYYKEPGKALRFMNISKTDIFKK